jgi:hypothetical protein
MTLNTSNPLKVADQVVNAIFLQLCMRHFSMLLTVRHLLLANAPRSPGGNAIDHVDTSQNRFSRKYT